MGVKYLDIFQASIFATLSRITIFLLKTFRDLTVAVPSADFPITPDKDVEYCFRYDLLGAPACPDFLVLSIFTIGLAVRTLSSRAHLYRCAIYCLVLH